MRFNVACSCGHSLRVKEGAAGARLSCPCGREVHVPALHELRVSAGLPPYPLSPELEIEYMLAREVPPEFGDCARCGLETSSLVHVITRFGEHVIGPSRADIIFAILLTPLWPFALSYLRRSRHLDKEYQLPLHLCPTCRPRVRWQWQFKACLRKVELYGRLLEKHPRAVVQIA